LDRRAVAAGAEGQGLLENAHLVCGAKPSSWWRTPLVDSTKKMALRREAICVGGKTRFFFAP